jgi:hypothetical protein
MPAALKQFIAKRLGQSDAALITTLRLKNVRNAQFGNGSESSEFNQQVLSRSVDN